MAFGWDDVLSAGVGLVGNLFSGGMNNQAAEDRQDSANAFSAQQFATRYQTTVKDMQAAGLNPMLAYSQGVGSSPSGAVSNAAPYGDAGSSINQSRLTSAQVANVEADTRNKEASADLIAGQAAAAWSSASQSNANVGLINANVGKVQAEIDKLRGDTNFEEQQRILQNMAYKLHHEGSLASERSITEADSRNVMRASIQKIFTEVGLNKLDLQAAERLENLGRTSRELKPIIDMMISVIRSSKR